MSEESTDTSDQQKSTVESESKRERERRESISEGTDREDERTHPELEPRWYWDNRNRKAYYPHRVDKNTITFVTVWHREEITDALATGAVEPITETSPEWFDSVFDHIDSFRFDVDVLDESLGAEK